ncbi:CRISPR-associated helicase Cas3' [Labilibaculum euxinus]
MRLSSSFKDIVNNAIPFFDHLERDYFAHISEEKKKESLKKHSVLVADYFLKLSQKNEIEPVVNNLINDFINSFNFATSDNIKKWIKQIFVCSIVYHDLGKINPNFQKDRMQNSDFLSEKLELKHYHSFLGGFIFMNKFYQDILEDENLSADELQTLFFVLILFVNPIAKHHSSKLSIEDYFSKSVLDEAYSFLKYYNLYIEKDYATGIFLNFNIIENTFKEITDRSSYFPLFSLLKLSYSLLTACDYYATNEYMANIVVDDFGILTPELKQKIYENFKTKKSYNKDLFEKFKEYEDMPFSALKEQSNANLNCLRQKLNVEVISTLRQNPNALWYYIEAPTGAGKTNLSLACISELLQTNKNLNKVFYVFPFTTLITQTFQGIQETIDLNYNDMIQLHSKASFHSQEESKDGEYGTEKQLYLDNLFVNYPFCVTSHVRFFDILKGNEKNSNYLMHRLCNSIVVIDELQTYNPSHWDKILFFIENYARLFNMRFIIMSATLPKIDALSNTLKGKFINLTPNKKCYFSNKNFAGRIEFDFSLLEIPKPTKTDKEEYLHNLSDFMLKQAKGYYEKHGHSRILIEFITKNTASHFFRLIEESDGFKEYKRYILSGDILEPQRKKIINELKNDVYEKVIVVSTQVVEAGVDIDMDIGFKDRSLLDSDEQLAGRINRNASKKDCKVFLFDCDSSATIYGKDKRYQHQQHDKEIYSGFKEILKNKEFDRLYEKVFEDAKKEDWTDGAKLNNYIENFTRLDFNRIHSEFQLIEDNDSESLYIPLNIDIPEEYSKTQLTEMEILTENGSMVSGEKLFDKYISIIMNNETDFIHKQIDLKKLTGLMSQFTISIYPNIKNKLDGLFDDDRGRYGYLYLSHWEGFYNLHQGFNLENAEQNIFL